MLLVLLGITTTQIKVNRKIQLLKWGLLNRVVFIGTDGMVPKVEGPP
jgi:hypothetical protein